MLGFSLRVVGTCSHHTEKEDATTPFADFNFDDVCKKGHTLLWDQVQDENAVNRLKF